MARYINSYSTAADVQSAIDGGTLNKPYVAYIENDDVIDWNSKEISDYSKIPLTIEVISGGTLVFASNYSGEYRLNGGEWVQSDTNTHSVNKGDTIELRNNGGYNANFGIIAAQSTCYYNVYGNVYSLLSKDDYTSITTMTGVLQGVFAYCFGLLDASDLVLPATVLKSNSCYKVMFSNCTNLVNGPKELPGTFSGEYDAQNCYHSMFLNCSKLTKSPRILINLFGKSRLQEMFKGCSSLNYIEVLSTSVKGNNLLFSDGVASTGTFVKKTGVGIPTGTGGIPAGWTVVNV